MIETIDEFTSGQKEFLKLAERCTLKSKRTAQFCHPWGSRFPAATTITREMFGKFVPSLECYDNSDDIDVGYHRPAVTYIHTGGTLAMVQSKTLERGLSFDGALNVTQALEICDQIAHIRKRFALIGIQLANLDSKEITPELWTSLALTIHVTREKLSPYGMVVGHGTHTLEYSANAIAFALMNTLTNAVVFTGSQLPITGYPGSDALANLTGAMRVASECEIPEVLAYVNGKIYRGTRVTKISDEKFDFLDARVTGPLGYLTSNRVRLEQSTRDPWDRNRPEWPNVPKKSLGPNLFPYFDKKIILLEITPALDAKDLEDILQSLGKEKSILLQAYGSGAIPDSFVIVLKKYLGLGYNIFLVANARDIGVIQSAEEEMDEDAASAHREGIVILGDMTRSAAAVKLMFLKGNQIHLTQNDDHGVVRKMDPGDRTNASRRLREEMLNNYVGEISDAMELPRLHQPLGKSW